MNEIFTDLQKDIDSLQTSYDDAEKILTQALNDWNDASRLMEQYEFDNLDALAASSHKATADDSEDSQSIK